MLVRDLKARLGELGMEWEESWIPAHDPRWKAVEVFFTEEQMAEIFDDPADEYGEHEEAISMFCSEGWKEAEERLKELGII